jgi:RimJ/RimL family protein N-acetyltransferase
MSAPLVAPTHQPHDPGIQLRFDKNGLPFGVRPLLDSDAPALLVFYDDFEPKRAAQGLPPKGIDRVRRWLNTILASGRHLLAFRDGVLIGHALLMPTQREGVAEYARCRRAPAPGQGVGTELTRAAIEAAREAGLRRLWLSVEFQNRAAVRSYEKAGFRFLPNTIYSPEAEMELLL